MDQHLVYRKTTAGEEALQSRARLSQHDLRVMLILVDGKKSVGDLIAKIGSVESVEPALYRLEQEGMIRPVAGHVSDYELEQSSSQLHAMFSKGDNGGSRPVERAEPSAIKFEPIPSIPTPAEKPIVVPKAPINIPQMPADGDLEKPKAVASAPVAPVIPASPPPKRVIPPMPADPENTSLRSETSKPVTPPETKPAEPPVVVAQSATPGEHGEARAEPQFSSWDEEEPPAAKPPDGKIQAVPPAALGAPDITPGQKAKRGDKPAAANPFVSSGPATQGGFEKKDWKDDQDESEKPRRLPEMPFRTPRSRKGLKQFIFVLVLLALITPVLVFLVYPFDSYRAALETSLSQSMGQPVSISRIRGTLAPAPTFFADSVSIGGNDGVSIREVKAVPDLLSLLGERQVFSEIRLDGVRVPLEKLGALSTALGGVSTGPSIGVRQVRFTRVSLIAGDLTLADYAGRAELNEEGKLRTMALTNGDGTLSVRVSGNADGGARLLAEGAGWQASPSSPFVFESIQIAGVLSGSEFVTDKIEGRLFGGVVKGSVRFAWDQGMSLETDIASEYMSTPILFTALGVPAVIDGQLDGRVRFSVAADSWSKLLASVPMAGDFTAVKGNIRGMDLVEAVRRAGKQAYRGGATKFDTLGGRFVWDGKVLRLSDLNLSSGIVNAFGSVSVSAGSVMEGSGEVLIKASSVRSREPVRVSGTLRDPELFAGWH